MLRNNNESCGRSSTEKSDIDNSVVIDPRGSLSALFLDDNFTRRLYGVISKKIEINSYGHLGVPFYHLKEHIVGLTVETLLVQGDQGKGPLAEPDIQDRKWQNWVIGHARIEMTRLFNGEKAKKLRVSEGLVESIEVCEQKSLHLQTGEEGLVEEMNTMVATAKADIEMFADEFSYNSIEKKIIIQKLYGKHPRDIAKSLGFEAKKVNDCITNLTKRYKRKYRESDSNPLHIRRKFIKASRYPGEPIFLRNSDAVRGKYGELY
jgi:hypothetical protein